MKLIITANGLQDSRMAPVKELAEEYFSSVVMNPWGRRGTQGEIRAIWDAADAIICGAESFDEKMIQGTPSSLKVLSHYGVGVDSIDIEAAKNRGIVVCNTPGANSTSVAEMALALILSLAKHIIPHNTHTKLGEWKRFPIFELEGKTIGIIGFGATGQALAKMIRTFNMEILVYDPYSHDDIAKKEGVKKVDLNHLLENSDIISLHAPCTEDTFRIINRESLSLMKETTLLINVARGDLIDEKALYHALKDRQIAGAGLDVYSREPAEKNKLFALENVVCTPHCAANTFEARLKMGHMAVENAYRVLMGLPGAHIVQARE